MSEVPTWVPQGWVCQVCTRVYSPTTVMCFYCGPKKINTGTTTGDPIPNPFTTPSEEKRDE